MGNYRNTSVRNHAAAILVTTLALAMQLISVKTERSTVNYGACPAGWQGWNGSCYKNVLSNPRSRTWHDAKSYCHGIGGHIATPNSRAEYDFMWDIFVATFPNSEPLNGVWIGCTDVDVEGVWACIGDTDQVSYRAEWYENNDSNRNCAVMSTTNLLWNVHPCDVLKYVMCERLVPFRTRSMTCSVVVTNRCLLNHIFKTINVKFISLCCLACHKDQRCRSFNLEGNQCELNDEAYSDDGQHQLAELEKCNYYEI